MMSVKQQKVKKTTVKNTEKKSSTPKKIKEVKKTGIQKPQKIKRGRPSSKKTPIESLSMEELAKLLQVPQAPVDDFVPIEFIMPKRTTKSKIVLKLFLIILSLCVLFFAFVQAGYLLTPDEDEKIHIAMAFDERYELGAGVAIYSILKNADYNDWHSFHILTNGISDDFKEKIKMMQAKKYFDVEYIDMPVYLAKNKLNAKQSPRFYRYYLSDLFPNIKKMLWLDADIMVYRSLRPLYQTKIKDDYVAGVEDANSCNYAPLVNLEKIFNAGILLFNLDKMRQDAMMKTILKTDWDLKKAGKREQADQTVLNVAFKDKIKWLPPKYNFYHYSYLPLNVSKHTDMACHSFKSQEIVKNWNEKVIYHYVYGKPWLTGPGYIGRDDFFRYLVESPWQGYWVQGQNKETNDVLIKLLNGQYIFTKQPRVLCDITERDKHIYVFCGDNKVRKFSKLFYDNLFFLYQIK